MLSKHLEIYNIYMKNKNSNLNLFGELHVFDYTVV